MKFPKYVGFLPKENPLSCLFRKGDPDYEYSDGDIIVYHRPFETGDWECSASYINGRFIIVECYGGPHLVGKELIEVTEEQFMLDNRGCRLKNFDSPSDSIAF